MRLGSVSMAELETDMKHTKRKFYTADGRKAFDAIQAWLDEDTSPTSSPWSQPEGTPWTECPSYRWNNARRCYLLKEADGVSA